MSGGSLDYIYCKVEEVAETLLHKNNTDLQRAFGRHLKKCAKALHDIEWVMSGDCGTGDDDEAIKDAMGGKHKEEILSMLKEEAESLIKRLEKAIQ